jgi:hypothetical protein
MIRDKIRVSSPADRISPKLTAPPAVVDFASRLVYPREPAGENAKLERDWRSTARAWRGVGAAGPRPWCNAPSSDQRGGAYEGATKGRPFLDGHFDVVPAGQVTRDPFGGQVSRRLYGRGACDMKAGLAAAVFAAEAIRRAGVAHQAPVGSAAPSTRKAASPAWRGSPRTAGSHAGG